VARAISVQALFDREPVGQATAPLIVRSTFLDPAREDGTRGTELQLDAGPPAER